MCNGQTNLCNWNKFRVILKISVLFHFLTSAFQFYTIFFIWCLVFFIIKMSQVCLKLQMFININFNCRMMMMCLYLIGWQNSCFFDVLGHFRSIISKTEELNWWSFNREWILSLSITQKYTLTQCSQNVKNTQILIR